MHTHTEEPHTVRTGQKEANPIREGKSSWYCDLKEHQGFKGALGCGWVSKPQADGGKVALTGISLLLSVKTLGDDGCLA